MFFKPRIDSRSGRSCCDNAGWLCEKCATHFRAGQPGVDARYKRASDFKGDPVDPISRTAAGDDDPYNAPPPDPYAAGLEELRKQLPRIEVRLPPVHVPQREDDYTPPNPYAHAIEQRRKEEGRRK